MAYLYLDDSKHHQFGFSLAAFVICDDDPTEEIAKILNRHGFDPSSFEYKSSAKMKGDDRLQALRSALKLYIGRKCKIAICVVDGDKNLGLAALKLLSTALDHPDLTEQRHQVFFDEGLFSSKKAAYELAGSDVALACCEFHFEQDSRHLLGIQLADIVAHTCSTMLLEKLGHVTKKIVFNNPMDSVYHGLEIELGFEMWAGIRYAFLSQNKANPKDDFDLANVDVYPWGLFVDESVGETISIAAMERFGENYLGCIH
ncbi:DUF3800 domain-containing protein [Thetidibacter halocola]|uniref:DUF3800 domain-containing protein n=1 Tax=Thetidibacter halocola TaxID=2827239 RepID=A0A8J7WES2_9RHOB|nr:DUF3800 domain-containing protein [Thetidibacter halocola]MBS0126292.1 DUF3800 domain-containing protein [Thetidibacter halocola]